MNPDTEFEALALLLVLVAVSLALLALARWLGRTACEALMGWFLPPLPPGVRVVRARPEVDAGRARLAAAVADDPDRRRGTDDALCAELEQLLDRPDATHRNTRRPS